MRNQSIMTNIVPSSHGSLARLSVAVANAGGMARSSVVLSVVLLGWAAGAQGAIPNSERAALQALYSATHGASWTTRDGWNGAAGTECTDTDSWFGVTCNADNTHVIAIDLESNNLVGTLPSLNDLTALQGFNVADNELSGVLPSLAGLRALQTFDVNSNQLTGPIPSLSGLTALQTFDVDNNLLTDALPSLSGLTALQIFDANSNLLTGTIPSLSGLTALTYFDVNSNQLTGTIPSLSGLTALQTFDISVNQLTGTLPSLSGLTALQDFWVGQNQITGTIPSLSGLSALQVFEAYGNQLSGSLPSLDGLTALENFWLGQNQLSGSLPSLSGLAALQTFDVSGNSLLTGTLPALNGLSALKNFSVQGAQLSGSIPALSGLKNLQQFIVSDNQLGGAHPDLSGLTALQTFSASRNKLSGSIPAFNSLPALQSFAVNGNQLSGAIPDLSALVSLQIFDVGNNKLTGKLPTPPASLAAGWSQLCGNSLSSSGNTTTDAAWGNWLACQTSVAAAPVITLVAGWNLVGNSVEAPITVASSFNDAAKVTSIWKWVASGSTPGITYPTWAFYTPTQGDGGKAYAASKGYDFLVSINAGEGFWVSAKAALTVALPTAVAVQSASFVPASASTSVGAHALARGWNLIAIGDALTPAQFDAAIANGASTQPAAGKVYTNLTSMWAWDPVQAKWYFWAPSLVNSNSLASYLQSKNFLDFAALTTSPAGTLPTTTGFWVNMP